jgi:hypothetical protein
MAQLVRYCLTLSTRDLQALASSEGSALASIARTEIALRTSVRSPAWAARLHGGAR